MSSRVKDADRMRDLAAKGTGLGINGSALKSPNMHSDKFSLRSQLRLLLRRAVGQMK